MTTALLPALEAFLGAAREAERQRVLLPLERKLERSLARAFDDQGQRFLRQFRHVRAHFPEPMLQETLSPDDWEPLFTAAELASLRLFEQPLTAIQAAALRAGGRAAIADLGLGLSFDLAHPEAVAWLQRVPLERIAGINATTREQIRTILVNAVEHGQGYQETAREIAATFKGYGTPDVTKAIRSRAHMIAVTETGDAYSEGALVVGRDLKRAGLEMEKAWLAEADACPICSGNADEDWIPLDQPFSSGDDAPTAHPSCRCAIETRAVVG
ncbi:MAG TPA: phage minor head protein [Dehalococcoidia bacterium]